MTQRAQPLSENGKLIAICLLFPLFWPFLPVLLLFMGIEKIKFAYWDWRAPDEPGFTTKAMVRRDE